MDARAELEKRIAEAKSLKLWHRARGQSFEAMTAALRENVFREALSIVDGKPIESHRYRPNA